MNLNHLNLCVDDLAAARDLFEGCFGLRTIDQKGSALAVLTDDAGFTLVLSSAPAFGATAPVAYPDGFHVGFVLDTPDAVDRARDRIAAAGVPVDQAPRRMHGAQAFYFTALGGLLFEVSSPLGA